MAQFRKYYNKAEEFLRRTFFG